MQNYQYEELFDVIDELILGVYASEILMKWYCSFTLFWRCGWNIFDFLIVVVMLAGVGKLVNFLFLLTSIFGYFLMERDIVMLDMVHYLFSTSISMLLLSSSELSSSYLPFYPQNMSAG